MYLSELEIVGFKSFATKTKFKFKGGITALVGPNGCGKTNIVDAIRWALGEQKSSVLRSDVMENVIFNGNSKRKPFGMAEVTLTIENTRNVLPSEYSVVNISRRLFRSGESTYLLNKSRCRLRDIHDLFMDTGMGADSYSVIELKMVEALLSGKPEERRRLFEEAAGVTKYKLRRKETAGKLKKVMEDLDRALDILAEVERNVNSLSRQAAKTKRYNSYLNELRTKEIKILAWDYNIHSQKAKETEVNLVQIDENKIATERLIESLEAELALMKESVILVENKLGEVNSSEHNLNKMIAEIKEKQAVGKEKINALQSAIERLKREISESGGAKERIERNIANAENALQEKIANEDDIEITADEKKSALNVAESALKAARQSLEAVQKEMNEVLSKINTLNSLKSRNDEKIESLRRRIAKDSEDRNQKKNSIADFTSQLSSLQERKLSLESQIEDIQQELNTAVEEKKYLESQLQNLKSTLADVKNKLSAQKAQKQFLENLTDSDQTTRWTLANKNFGEELSALAEAVFADDKFRIAIAGALGDAAHHIICRDISTAEKIFSELEKAGKGKINILVKGSNFSASAPASAPPSESLGWLSEIINAEPEVVNFLRLIWGKMAVVEDFDTAKAVVNSGKADSCVTLKGEIYSNSGLLRGGGLLKDEGATVGKLERIKQCDLTISKFQKDIETIDFDIADLNDRLAEIDINQLNNNLKKAQSELMEQERLYSQIELKIEAAENSLELMEQSQIRYEKEIEEILNENSEFEAQQIELSERKELTQTMVNSELTQVQQLDQQRIALSKEATEADLELVRLKSEIKSIKTEIERFNGQLTYEERRKEQRNNELGTNMALLETLEMKSVEFVGELETLNKELKVVLSDKQFNLEEIKNLREDIETKQSEMKTARFESEKVKESLYKNEAALHEAQAKIAGIIERCTEEYDTDISTTDLEFEEDYDIKTQKIELQEIRQKLSQLGNVNFMALEEYEEQNERFQFYTNQINDLKEAEKTLTDTINEINTAAQKNFSESFAQIRLNFKYLFSKLFNEQGECDILLKDGDPLETDIEITAKPPGKKPHSIEMLSGGEKTLTAIALLFAIYMVKPSPFCILDEVDAPLDDANIGRFITMIREFSDKTQFMIVTHNKKTMEAADTLYGITQQETGVSKIVSVRLTNDEAGKEEISDKESA